MSEQVAPPPRPGDGQESPAPADGAVQRPEQTSGVAGIERLAVVGVIVVAVVIVGLAFGIPSALLGGDKAVEAKVGDCIANLPQVAQGEERKAPNAAVVDCGSGEAKYSVIGRVEDRTEAQAADQAVCEPYAPAGAEYWYYSIAPGEKGAVLCLKATS